MPRQFSCSAMQTGWDDKEFGRPQENPFMMPENRAGYDRGYNAAVRAHVSYQRETDRVRLAYSAKYRKKGAVIAPRRGVEKRVHPVGW